MQGSSIKASSKDPVCCEAPSPNAIAVDFINKLIDIYGNNNFAPMFDVMANCISSLNSSVSENLLFERQVAEERIQKAEQSAVNFASLLDHFGMDIKSSVEKVLKSNG